MKKEMKILFTYVLITIMMFLLCGCQSKSKNKSDDSTNDTIEDVVSDEQEFEDDSKNETTSNGKQNSEDYDFSQSFSDTQISDSNTNTETSNPSTSIGNSKPSTNTQNTKPSTNINTSEDNTDDSEQKNDTSTNTNSSTPSTSTETSKPTETTPEQPKRTHIAGSVYGCGMEHTQVVNGITFHWYDRYENVNTYSNYVYYYLDIHSFSMTYEEETPLPQKNSRYIANFDLETDDTSLSFGWLSYDEDGYYLGETSTGATSGTPHYITGKCRGGFWCRGHNLMRDEKMPSYVELYPRL